MPNADHKTANSNPGGQPPLPPDSPAFNAISQRFETRTQVPRSGKAPPKVLKGLQPFTTEQHLPVKYTPLPTDLAVPDLPKPKPKPNLETTQPPPDTAFIKKYKELDYYDRLGLTRPQYPGQEPTPYQVVAAARELKARTGNPEMLLLIDEAANTLRSPELKEGYHDKLQLPKTREVIELEIKETERKARLRETLEVAPVQSQRSDSTDSEKSENSIVKSTNPAPEQKSSAQALFEKLNELPIGENPALREKGYVESRRARLVGSNKKPNYARGNIFQRLKATFAEFVGIEKKKDPTVEARKVRYLREIYEGRDTTKKTGADQQTYTIEGEVISRSDQDQTGFLHQGFSTQRPKTNHEQALTDEKGRSQTHPRTTLTPEQSYAIRREFLRRFKRALYDSFGPGTEPIEERLPARQTPQSRQLTSSQSDTAQEGGGGQGKNQSKRGGLLENIRNLFLARGLFGLLTIILTSLTGFLVTILIALIAIIGFIGFVVIMPATEKVLEKELSDYGSSNFFKVLEFGGAKPTYVVDGAGNITSIAYYIRSELNSKSTYNARRLENGTQVVGVRFDVAYGFTGFMFNSTGRSQMGDPYAPKQIEDLGSSISYTPSYCSDIGIDCQEEVGDEVYVVVKFAIPPQKLDLNNRVCLTLSGNVSIKNELYPEAWEYKFIGKPLVAQTKCFSLTRDPNNAEIATTSGTSSSGSSSGSESSSSTVEGTSCPFASIPSDEQVRCTNPYIPKTDPNKYSHEAIDINVGKTGSGSPLPAPDIYKRNVHAPIDGNLEYISLSNAYTDHAGFGIRITSTDGKVRYDIYHVQPDASLKAGPVQKGAIIGTMYRGTDIGANSKWKGPHIHIERYVDGKSTPEVLNVIEAACPRFDGVNCRNR